MAQKLHHEELDGVLRKIEDEKVHDVMALNVGGNVIRVGGGGKIQGAAAGNGKTFRWGGTTIHSNLATTHSAGGLGVDGGKAEVGKGKGNTLLQPTNGNGVEE